MPRRPLLRTGVALALLAAPPVAGAQAPESDPSADSPSGHVYELALDAARADAAPQGYAGPARDGSGETPGGPSGATPSGPSGATPSGPSGETPADASGPSGATPSASAGADAAPSSGRVSAIRSENGFGSSSQVPGVDRPAAPALASSAASDPSGARVYGLLVLGALLAAGVGLAGRAARRDR